MTRMPSPLVDFKNRPVLSEASEGTSAGIEELLSSAGPEADGASALESVVMSSTVAFGSSDGSGLAWRLEQALSAAVRRMAESSTVFLFKIQSSCFLIRFCGIIYLICLQYHNLPYCSLLIPCKFRKFKKTIKNT